MLLKFSLLNNVFLESQSHVSGPRRQWNWDTLRKPSLSSSEASTSFSSKLSGKRKQSDLEQAEDSDDGEFKRGKTLEDKANEHQK